MSNNNSRSYALDFVKIVATILIVFHHFQQNTGAFYENFPNFWGSWFYWGYIVELFFLLSGYFMYRYVAKIQSGELSLGKWVGLRAKRLLPMVAISSVAYEASILIYKAITGTVWPYFGELSLFGTIITALGIQGGYAFTNPGVNNPVWYVSILILCYVVFYIICALSKKLNCSPIYFFVFMILLGVSTQTFNTNQPFLTVSVGRGYYSFFFGLILAAFVQKFGVGKKTIITSAVALVASIVLFMFPEQAAKEPLVYVLTFITYPAIVLLFSSSIANKIFKAKAWGVIGSITFNVYLWHSPLFPLMYGMLALFEITPDFSGVWTMLVFTLVSFAVGAASYFLIEKPVDKLINRIIEKSTKKEELSAQ